MLAPKAVPGKVRGLEGEGLTSPLVGRAAELRLVAEKVEEVRGGRGAFVAVVGEAGLGKSRLLAEVRKLEGWITITRFAATGRLARGGRSPTSRPSPTIPGGR